MSELYVLLGAAYGIGLTSSLHPCPLTTHIALFSLLCSWSSDGVHRLRYITAFLLAYIGALVLIGLLIGSSILAFDDVARTIQIITKRLMGPVLMFVGLIVTGLIPWRQSSFEQKWKRLKDREPSIAASIIMGFIFAIAFCPATAALFFGVMLPVAISNGQVIACSALYGLGVLTPLLIILLLTLKSTFVLDSATGKARVWSKRLSMVSGSVLLIIGLFLSLRDIYAY